jgi:hypothetical protein
MQVFTVQAVVLGCAATFDLVDLPALVAQILARSGGLGAAVVLYPPERELGIVVQWPGNDRLDAYQTFHNTMNYAIGLLMRPSFAHLGEVHVSEEAEVLTIRAQLSGWLLRFARRNRNPLVCPVSR